jgi:alanine racemase
VDEGVELREAGIERPIVIFTPLLHEDLDAAHRARLTPTLGYAKEIDAWEKYGSPYYLSIDTGMARAGIPWREAADLDDTLKRVPPEAVFTHFHSPGLDDGSMDVQLARFAEALERQSNRPRELHTDSSAAIVRHDASPVHAVRPGIFMYGVGSNAELEPEPVVFVKSRIVEIRRVEAGDTVSYDATWAASRPSLIATIPLGYADGYPRGASNSGWGVVRDQAVRVAGRVTMDMIMLDVTDASAEVGDVVTMIGKQEGGAQIDVAGVAAAADISPYELLTGLRSRLQRVYRGE